MADGLNPQQLLFKEAYLNPSSATFGNANQSALAAGYSIDYADCITGRGNDWLSGIVRDYELLFDSEKALREAVTYNILDDDGKRDVGVAGLKLKASMFVAETLGKAKYSKQSAFGGVDENGKPIPILFTVLAQEQKPS